jgi:uncharacterized membrane protein
MEALTLFTVTAIIFLAADAVMLKTVIQPLFRHHLGNWLHDPLRLAPAGLFYLAYVAGLVWLVSWSAHVTENPQQALLNGAVLGAVAYGTYEFTNVSTLTRWSASMVAVDLAWGTLITGLAAYAGVQITGWLW